MLCIVEWTALAVPMERLIYALEFSDGGDAFATFVEHTLETLEDCHS